MTTDEKLQEARRLRETPFLKDSLAAIDAILDHLEQSLAPKAEEGERCRHREIRLFGTSPVDRNRGQCVNCGALLQRPNVDSRWEPEVPASHPPAPAAPAVEGDSAASPADIERWNASQHTAIPQPAPVETQACSHELGALTINTIEADLDRAWALVAEAEALLERIDAYPEDWSPAYVAMVQTWLARYEQEAARREGGQAPR